jgi:phosphate starvation-inducible protein PhoH and related proteins
MSSKREAYLEPKTLQQALAIELFTTNDILILTGPAGSGKTHVATALAAEAILSQRARKLILSRPVVPAGEELGFLPGDLNKKMGPWLLPFHDVLRHITHQGPQEFFKEHVEICPIAYLRGRTFERCVAILDEAQNASYQQLKLFATRIGYKAKLIITGDTQQSDRVDSGLSLFRERLVNCPGVAQVALPTEVSPRHPIIPELLSRL